MSVPSSVVPFFRTQWATRLVDTCLIEEINNATRVWDDVNGVYTDNPVTIYSGACLVRPVSRPDVEQTFGQELVDIQGFKIFIPYDETGVKPDHRVTVTSTFDGRLNGMVLTVRLVNSDTYNTVRELSCEEQQDDAKAD